MRRAFSDTSVKLDDGRRSTASSSLCEESRKFLLSRNLARRSLTPVKALFRWLRTLSEVLGALSSPLFSFEAYKATRGSFKRAATFILARSNAVSGEAGCPTTFFVSRTGDPCSVIMSSLSLCSVLLSSSLNELNCSRISLNIRVFSLTISRAICFSMRVNNCISLSSSSCKIWISFFKSWSLPWSSRINSSFSLSESSSRLFMG